MALEASDWDRRYTLGAAGWRAMPPHPLVVGEIGALGRTGGTALDLGAGTGRHTLWLAEHGWAVTAVDFSGVALAHLRERAAAAGLAVRTVEADLAGYEAPAPGFDLALISYVHPNGADRTAMLRHAWRSLAPGGVLVVVGNHLDNIRAGVGGPTDPEVMYTPERLLAALPGTPGVRAERVAHTVDTGPGTQEAYAVVLRAVREEPATDRTDPGA